MNYIVTVLCFIKIGFYLALIFKIQNASFALLLAAKHGGVEGSSLLLEFGAKISTSDRVYNNIPYTLSKSSSMVSIIFV